MKLASGILALAALASRSMAAASIFSARDVTAINQHFEAAHVNTSNYAHDLHVFVQDGQPDSQSSTLHSDALAAVAQLEATIVEIKSNGAISSTDAPSVEAIAAGIESTMNDVCQTILSNILPTASTHIQNLLTEDLSELSSVFDSTLTTLESFVPASVATQIASLRTQFDAVCPA